MRPSGEASIFEARSLMTLPASSRVTSVSKMCIPMLRDAWAVVVATSRVGGCACWAIPMSPPRLCAGAAAAMTRTAGMRIDIAIPHVESHGWR